MNQGRPVPPPAPPQPPQRKGGLEGAIRQFFDWVEGLFSNSQKKAPPTKIPSQRPQPHYAPQPKGQQAPASRKQLSKTKIKQMLHSDFVAVDIETTGFNPEKNAIIEIGAVKVVNGTVVDTFQTFVNPCRKITAKATTLTGIDNSMLKGAPVIEDAFPGFLEFIAGLPLVAHNASFDMRFLNHHAVLLGVPITNQVVDTLQLSRHCFGHLHNHKLDTIAAHLQLDMDDHHRALSDCHTAACIYMRCVDLLSSAR